MSDDPKPPRPTLTLLPGGRHEDAPPRVPVLTLRARVDLGCVAIDVFDTTGAVCCLPMNAPTARHLAQQLCEAAAIVDDADGD